MGAPIRETLVLADSFSQTFRNFDVAANAAIRVTEEFAKALDGFSEGFLDGLVSSLNESRQELDNMSDAADGAAKSQDKITKATSGTDNEIKKAKDSEDKFTESIRNSDNAAGSLMKTLSKIAGAVGVAKLTESFIETSDEMAQITAKLDMINDGSRTTAQLQEAIYESAQKSRGSYLDTANLIARIGMNAGEAFYDQVLKVNSNNKMLQFAENLNKAFKISGASAQEQASVILQMSQALGSGVLRGQEFNTVMSSATIVMQKVAEYLGVGIGDLKQMAADGQLTADILVRSMLYATDSINAQFAKIPRTFSDVMTTTKNQIVKSLNDSMDQWMERLNGDEMQDVIDKITKAITTLAEVGGDALLKIADIIVWIGEKWEDLMPIIETAGAAIITYKILNLKAAGEVAAAWAAAHGPLGLISIAVGGLVTVLTETDAFGIFAEKATLSADEIIDKYGEAAESIRTFNYVLDHETPDAIDWACIALETLFGILVDILKVAIAIFNFIPAAFWSIANGFDGDSFTDVLFGGLYPTVDSVSDWLWDDIDKMLHPTAPPAQVNPVWEAKRVKEKGDWYAQYYGEKPKDEWYGAHIDQNADWYAQYYGRDTGVHITEESWKAIQDMRDNGVKIKGEVKLSDEDLQIFRDIAENRYIANVSLETLAPNVSVNVENNGQNLSEDDIATAVTRAIETQISERTAISHG